MRRLVVYAILAAALTASLFAARAAGRRLVYETLHAADVDRIDDTSRAWVRRDQVEADFAAAEHPEIANSAAPSIRLARFLGRPAGPTILMVGLIVPLPILVRRPPRRAAPPPP